ncbi:MFS transporter [Asanoa sp. WMMD1127]|uniref:MFS transporter n=1 Tax=Asanoa sp. WMMD1127 TaxID=3016107 RepID=UPI002415BBAC|nr:MFS transporter [Asanoa sp. WMMD1127]MDG4824417.1 MFS transporter [Asanoa sp. WMMD1127]
MPPEPRPRSASAWAPLGVTTFRWLWLALLASNIGTWMQTVGAQWLLVDAPGADALVSLVQTASMLPIVLLALPSGALADTFDRRRLLLVVQSAMCAVAVLLAVLTWLDRMPPALLLTLTFALGAGQALTVPAWQAVIPELVPRSQLASASALGAISMNVARAVGPAVAGVLIASTGVASVFLLNALSFVVFAAVLVWWRRPDDDDLGPPERFTAAVKAGGRYVTHSVVVRRILLRAGLFLLPGSAIWALLPLVASRRLGLGSGGYGVLLAALGVGAVAGAALLPRIRQRLSPNRMMIFSGLLFGAVMIVVGLVPVEAVVALVLVPAGLAWVTVLSSVNANLQLFLPNWVRARGLSIYQMIFAGAQGVGALLWGLLAGATSVPVALLAAGALMLAGAATTVRWPMPSIAGLDREPTSYWPEPHLDVEPEPYGGPVLVTLRYQVPAANEAEFRTAMDRVRLSRRRSGAVRWGLFREGEHGDRFVEVYQVASWDEHRRQHEHRLTGTDREIEAAAQALADGPPEVTHLLPAESAPAESEPGPGESRPAGSEPAGSGSAGSVPAGSRSGGSAPAGSAPAGSAPAG